ncbi:MAG: helix-turn-helix domain-containing protein [Candidatus Altiarchaeia archaeon]
MDNKKLLQDIGLNKYEAASYLFLAENGVSDANTVSECANVPLGKMYATLTSLKSMGLIEVQESRPKKYKAIPPEKAFKEVYEQKKKDSEKELGRYRETIEKLRKDIRPEKKGKEPDTFWTLLTADKERVAALKNVIDECEKEFCFLMPAKVIRRRGIVEEVAPRITRHFFSNIKSGVRARIIFPEKEFIREKHPLPDDADLSKVEARILPSENGYYLVDNKLVMIPVFDPSEENSIFGMIKISDSNYASRVKKRFEEAWKKAAPIDLEKELGREQ